MKTFVYMTQDGSSIDDFGWNKVEAETREEADNKFREIVHSWGGSIGEEDEFTKEDIDMYLDENEYLLDVIEIPNKNENHLECSPTGRITYRQLRDKLNQMSEEQLDMDVTIEIAWDDECFAGELTICGPEHGSLDDFHPTIRTLADKDDYMSEEFEK
jgi:hypothetical protein